MEVTIGGDRLGSGKKMTQELHNYYRSTFNQEQDWKSSMQCGTLYPFLCVPMTNGDSMDIDLDAFVRTLPTKGPLFGSFKLQADIFSVPMRLYNGILHNNPNDIGLKMSRVYMPKLKLAFDKNTKGRIEGADTENYQIAQNCLLKYLGLSGVGTQAINSVQYNMLERKINAIPALAYYDIFKNYYANKQEEYAYVFGPGEITNSPHIDYIEIFQKEFEENDAVKIANIGTRWPIIVRGNSLDLKNCWMEVTYDEDNEDVSLEEWSTNGYITITKNTDTEIKYYLTETFITNYQTQAADYIQVYAETTENGRTRGNVTLKKFKLSNIDKMREDILKETEFDNEFVIGLDQGFYLPYQTLIQVGTITDGDQTLYINNNQFSLNGLCVKTYQSDLFNNWIQTDWIEGENGIAALSAVNVSEGTLQMDALNLAQKVYNMLNRIAVSGGTYEDWQEAVYSNKAVRKAETPVYEGGMSGEIMFEEVIQTAETNVDDDPQALGSLGGKGTLIGTKGGKNIHIEATEPIFVMGILSITPRICYTQGNEWYLTELNSFDDLHKPALDGIGFQNLMAEQMAWWGTKINQTNGALVRQSAGKVVAWANYMTAVDHAYGDFASPGGKGYMVLARNYEYADTNAGISFIKDLTTYIDPAKFNYAFAYAGLDSQNFWVQIHSKVITRRYMSAHQIPNL